MDRGAWQATTLDTSKSWTRLSDYALNRLSSKKNPPANAGDVGSVPELGRSPGEGNGNPLRILVWEISWTEEPGGLQSMGSQKTQTQLGD